ncbi:hypothetical protein MKX03_027611 [Papaver bracteatum]|nr:hypothetical protein MKX03_027611 [Papaver bracteatum]
MELAAIFVSPILGDLIPKLLTYCSDEFNLVWDVKGDLIKLAKTLQKIEDVLHDAEKRQVGNMLVKNWLGELKDVAYDTVDIFDELHIKDLQQKMKNVSKVLPCLPLKPFGFDYKIAHKVKQVNIKLDGITKNMKHFEFIQLEGRSTSVMNEIRSETASHINDSAAVVGRTDDRSEILDLLNQDDYSVIRITGMGGMGKTTLAQLVYADASDDNFVIKNWVSMYGKSKLKEIFLDLLEPNADSQSKLDAIKDSLKEKLMVGKCLIVLDDVWINHGIEINELLKDLFSLSFPGSKILMTMRSAEEIPPMTDCRYKIYQLLGLPGDDCWSVIKKTAFAHGGAEESEDLINIGRKIAIKCGGLPLAEKTLGGLLYYKKNREDWLSILKSQIWNIPGENKIISILKLSYDHLSPHVKRCFSYCSIFPKGRMFSKKELIRMWMAERFLVSHGQANASPEAIGNEYFKILLLNSFFQEDRKNIWGDINSCRMHDLVHDLAVSTAGSESLNITTDDVPEGIDQYITFRRLGLQVLDYGVSTAIPSETYKSFKKLRTFVYSGSRYGDDFLEKHVYTFSLLRVLNLSCTGIQELPQSICKLKHLRYFDVKGCSRLRELPQDMRKLIGLEYLIFSNKKKLISKMPIKVSRLSELKKLPVFVVGEEGKGSGIEELNDLNLLGGKLRIENLGRVTDGTQANLIAKKNLTHLELSWDSPGCNDPDRIIKDAEVIHDLQPHRNLQKLGIINFGGSNFPTWMRGASTHLPNLVHITLDGCNQCELPAQQYPNLKRLRILNFGGSRFSTWIMTTSIHFPNLVSVTLYRCNECEHFPALGGLQFLKYLCVDGFGGVKKIGNEFSRSNEEAVSFPSLVQLHVYHYTTLVTFVRSRASTFSGLEELEIQNFPKLSTTPTEFPSLRKLYFHIDRQVDPKLKSLSPRLLWGVLQTLLVSGCNSFVGFLPDNDEEQQHHQQGNIFWNNHLSKLEINRCPSLTVLPPDFRGLNSLTYLAIEECSSLQSLPDGIQYLPALETLIIGFPSLSSLPEWFGELSSMEKNKFSDLFINASSPSLLDHIRRDADMNLELLARRRSGIFSNHNKEKRWIDSSGRNCIMLFPRSFNIAWGDDTSYWTWLSITEPSAASNGAEIEVPELRHVCWLDVPGILDMSKLTTGVNYEVVFIVMLRDRSSGWGKPVNLCLVLPDGQRLVQTVVLESMPK